VTRPTSSIPVSSRYLECPCGRGLQNGPGICARGPGRLAIQCLTEETEMSLSDGRPWEGDGDLPWDTPDGEWEPAETEAWRGELHLGEWPENLAGPEYWLYKKQQGDE
jgi:hypothetical protein